MSGRREASAWTEIGDGGVDIYACARIKEHRYVSGPAIFASLPLNMIYH